MERSRPASVGPRREPEAEPRVRLSTSAPSSTRRAAGRQRGRIHTPGHAFWSSPPLFHQSRTRPRIGASGGVHVRAWTRSWTPTECLGPGSLSE